VGDRGWGRGATASRPFARARGPPTRSAIVGSFRPTDATQSRPYLIAGSHPPFQFIPQPQSAIRYLTFHTRVTAPPIQVQLGDHGSGRPTSFPRFRTHPLSPVPFSTNRQPLTAITLHHSLSHTSNVYFSPSTSPSLDQASFVKCRFQSAGKKRSPGNARWMRVMKSLEQSGRPSA